MTKEDVHVRVDEAVMQGVRAYAKANGISLAAAVSILLRRGLTDAADRDKGRPNRG